MAPVEIDFQPGTITHPAFRDRGDDSIHAIVNWLGSRRYADSTLASYVSKVRLYVEFATLHGQVHQVPGAPPGATGSAVLGPIDATLLCFYVGWIVQSNRLRTFDTIKSYISALVSWCTAKGRPDPRLDPATGLTDPRYFAVFRGLKRHLGAPRPKRYPVTLWHLDHLHRAAEELLPVKQCANMQAATKLAFAAMLRVSEFTTKPTDQDPTTAARRGDVRFVPSRENPQYVHFTIRISKTDQYRETCTVTVAKAADPTRCPVRALKKLFEVDPQPDHAPLFNFTSDLRRTRGTPGTASRQQFADLCSALFAYAGIDDMRLKPHSFRQGGASALLAAGAPEWVIKTMGRWRSDCWTMYAFTDGEVIAAWARDMLTPTAVPIDYSVTPPTRLCDY